MVTTRFDMKTELLQIAVSIQKSLPLGLRDSTNVIKIAVWPKNTVSPNQKVCFIIRLESTFESAETVPSPVAPRFFCTNDLNRTYINIELSPSSIKAVPT